MTEVEDGEVIRAAGGKVSILWSSGCSLRIFQNLSLLSKVMQRKDLVFTVK